MKWEGPQAGLYMAIKSVANGNKFLPMQSYLSMRLPFVTKNSQTSRQATILLLSQKLKTTYKSVFGYFSKLKN